MKKWRIGERVRYLGHKPAIVGCVGVVLGDGRSHDEEPTCLVRFDGHHMRWSVPDASLECEDRSVPATDPQDGW